MQSFQPSVGRTSPRAQRNVHNPASGFIFIALFFTLLLWRRRQIHKISPYGPGHSSNSAIGFIFIYDIIIYMYSVPTTRRCGLLAIHDVEVSSVSVLFWIIHVHSSFFPRKVWIFSISGFLYTCKIGLLLTIEFCISNCRIRQN